MPSLAEAIGQVAQSFTGQLLQSTDTRYDESRRVHNGLINKHPVDVRARTARAQGGVLWKELNRETQVYGLASGNIRQCSQIR